MRWSHPFIGAVAIVALAAALRLWRLDLVEFKNDEAGWLRLAEDMVRLGRVPLVGEESSIGIRNPPDFVYILAPIVAFTRDPRVASAAVAIANAAGVAGTLFLGWTRFTPLVGLVAGLTYATNPWAVFFGRKVWNEDLVAPVAVLFFLALDRGVIGQEMVWAAAAFPIFMVGVQLHASLAVLTPVPLALGVYLIGRRQWRALLIGLILAALTFAPYVYFNYRNGWAELVALRNSLSRPPSIDGDGLAFVIQLTGGWNNWSLIGVHLEDLLPGWLASIPARVDTTLLGIGIVSAIVLEVSPGPAQGRERLRIAAVALWLVLPAVLTIRHGIPLYDHYFLFVPPAAALLIGIGVQWVADTARTYRRSVATVAVTGLVGVAAIQTLLVQRELDLVTRDSATEYGPPLAQSEALARDIAGFGKASGSTHFAVELEAPDSESVAYLARPSFANVDLIKIGPVGLGDRRVGALPIDGVPTPIVLAPAESLDMRYADSVEVLAETNSTHAVAGERVGLAMSWLVEDPSVAAGKRVQWHVSLLDADGVEISSGTGLQHVVDPAGPREIITSWFAVETPTDAPRGAYQLHLGRLDEASGQTMPFARVSGEVGTDWTSGPIVVA